MGIVPQVLAKIVVCNGNKRGGGVQNTTACFSAPTIFSHVFFFPQDFSLDVFLTQQWVDERLDHGTDSTITVNYKDLDKIWLPDTYFVNAKDSSFHYVTNENKLLQIGPNALVSYRIR